MARKFTKIPQNTFDALQVEAGVLLKRFDPENPAAPASEDIVCATTGGINPTCVPTYSDFGEDVDNVPLNMMEFKHLDGWECKIATTGLGTSPELIKLSLGAADINGVTKIVPRSTLKNTDFSDLWWVGDKANGGLVAVRLMNALSTGGFSLQTGKNAKGQVALEITGHVSINAQDVMPMEFYSMDGDGEDIIPSIGLDNHLYKINVGGTTEIHGERYPADAEISWTTSNDAVATVANGTVTGVAEGNCIITASITVEGVTYSDTCTVIVEAGE